MKRKRSTKPPSQAQLEHRSMFVFMGSLEGLRVRLSQLAIMPYIPYDAMVEVNCAREHITNALKEIGRS